MKTIVAAAELPFSPEQWQRLKTAAAPDRLLVIPWAELGGHLDGVEVAILAGDLDERVLAAPALRWVHCDHAGLTRSARPDVLARGLAVTGSAGRSAEALAEHVLMFTLMLGSRYPVFYEAQKRGEWLKRNPELDRLRALYGRTIGIIGMGHTGQALATRAKAFGMQVLGYRRRDMPPPPGVDRIFSADRGETIEPILEAADVLALVVNLSDATYHLIDEPAIRRLKRGAIIVNMARGAVIDQDALIRALEDGHLAGAGLDVTDPEPLPPGHPLWTTPNTLITPHFTAAVPDRPERSLKMIIENLRRHRAGEPLLNQMTGEDVWTARPA